ncbi:fungal-specific transcription factor domain-containing protein [Lophiotrema nucula]|uniref:Fungal-specific transcription factor domain-containing protein n=1 Tax=Lophiotrema nucula TaxID=690887 RepID=A0A6A5Z2A8_9PLEO|nr:fungal-specific transcription factor domain-containing protein [Lophiotrema nucula]
MNRLPSIPSRPAPPQPFTSYSPYPRSTVAPSRPEIGGQTQHHRPRDHEGTQSHAQQLPSLRTLLEPELLDTKLPDHTSRSGGALPSHGSSVRYGSTSPTLKRRHDFDSYSHGHAESNAMASRAPPEYRHPYTNTASDIQSLPFSTTGPRSTSRQSEFSRHGPLGRLSHSESASKMFRPGSTMSALSTSSDPAVAQAMQDDPMDMIKAPVRRRTEGSSRAPVSVSRCLGQREVPGEGLCYVYEDGTYCRVIIDGEPVNPQWGITKAGKPRKRLAQACLTCREKKIKCEPGYPKCTQCAKSQRACRGGLNQAGMSNASEETSPSSSTVVFKNQSTELVSPVAGPDKPRAHEEHRDPSRTVEAWNAGSPFKPRTFRPNSVATSRDMSVHSLDSDWSGPLNPDPDDPRRGSHQDQLALQWEQDPYETDPRLTMHLLDLYFLHAGRATYGMFPRKPFSTWVETNREKSQDHLMLLYSVLAMGSIFSNDPDKRSIGRRFAAIAAYGTEKRFGKFTLQLCQSRLMLALYNFARGKAQEAWDFCGAGLRAISALKLNIEEGVKELPDSTPDLDYGFDRRTLEECCRRTFWSGFLMDRYNGFCGGTLCVINIEDTFLHLPCSEDVYEASNPCDTPFFDFDLLSRQPSSPSLAPGTLGHMAFLTLISAIWGEVLTFTSRAVYRPDTGYERLYESFYVKTYERLEVWNTMLPENLRSTQQNLDNSIMEGNAGTFISLHALYYTTIIRLNRHVKMRALPVDKIVRNINTAFRGAHRFLGLMHSLAAPNRQRRLPPTAAAEFLFSTPFPGYALMLSVDILSAAGTVSTLPSLIETLSTAVSCVEELGNFWASARAQQKAISNRIKQLTDIAMQEEQGIRNGSFGQFWRTNESLETAFGEEDAVYKAGNELLFQVVGGR